MRLVEVVICAMLLSVLLSSTVLAGMTKWHYENCEMNEDELNEYCSERGAVRSCGIAIMSTCFDDCVKGTTTGEYSRRFKEAELKKPVKNMRMDGYGKRDKT